MSRGIEDYRESPSSASKRPQSAQEWAKAMDEMEVDERQLPLPGISDVPKPPRVETSAKIGRSPVDKPPAAGDKGDRLHDEEVADRKANRNLREKYADKAYQLAHFCLVWWMGMLFMQGMLMATNKIALWSDNVLVAVTGGVTASVLAAFLGVIRGLFPGDKNGANGKAEQLKGG